MGAPPRGSQDSNGFGEVDTRLARMEALIDEAAGPSFLPVAPTSVVNVAPTQVDSGPVQRAG